MVILFIKENLKKKQDIKGNSLFEQTFSLKMLVNIILFR